MQARGSTAAPTVTALGPDVRQHTFTGLVQGAAYDLSVRARNSIGAGPAVVRALSLADAAQYGQTAAPPARVIVRRGTGRVTVVWTPPGYEGASAVTGYRVRTYTGRTTHVLRSSLVTSVARSLVVTGLVNGAAYTVDVTPINARGLGTPSRRSNVVVPAGPPAAPVSVTAWSGVPGGRASAVVAWTAPRVTGGARITGYVITAWRYNRLRHLVGVTTLPLRPTTTQPAILVIMSGWYRFSVRAVNAVGPGATTPRSALVVSR